MNLFEASASLCRPLLTGHLWSAARCVISSFPWHPLWTQSLNPSLRGVRGQDFYATPPSTKPTPSPTQSPASTEEQTFIVVSAGGECGCVNPLVPLHAALASSHTYLLGLVEESHCAADCQTKVMKPRTPSSRPSPAPKMISHHCPFLFHYCQINMKYGHPVLLAQTMAGSSSQSGDANHWLQALWRQIEVNDLLANQRGHSECIFVFMWRKQGILIIFLKGTMKKKKQGCHDCYRG